MKQINAVLRVLRDGPATSFDVSEETGLSIKAASAYLSMLVADNLAEVVGEVRYGDRGRAFRVVAIKATP
mgnify:CR=1 FL=1